jgi:hypothetical protein
MTHGSHSLGPSIGLCTQLTALICSRSAAQCERQVLDCSAGDRPNPHCCAWAMRKCEESGWQDAVNEAPVGRAKPEKVFP